VYTRPMSRFLALTLTTAALTLPCGCASDACIGGSLEDYCAGPCRSFDEALAAANALEEQDVPFCDDGTLRRSYSGVGTCNDFRWVELRPSLDSRIEFFDAAGTMVAAEYSTDCNCFCGDTSFSKTYGPVPNCERVRTDEPCEVIPFSLGRSPLGCEETNDTTLLFDDTFAEEDWITEIVLHEANGEPSDFEYSSEQVESTIDANTFRLTRHTIDTQSCSAEPCGYSMKGVNRRVGWTYDPQTSGEIDHIHYTESQRVRLDQGSIPRAGLEWTFVVFQESGSGEQVRYEVASGEQEIASSSWQDKGNCTLSPDDFTPAGLDFDGPPLSFGYARRTTADSQGTRLTLEHSIDHFRIAIVPK
jgi:hypothetical protein